MEVSTAVALNTLRKGRQLWADPILDHYSKTLTELNEIGFATYAQREMAPYWQGAIANFKS
jgi:hypothetical protein